MNAVLPFAREKPHRKGDGRRLCPIKEHQNGTKMVFVMCTMIPVKKLDSMKESNRCRISVLMEFEHRFCRWVVRRQLIGSFEAVHCVRVKVVSLIACLHSFTKLYTYVYKKDALIELNVWFPLHGEK